MKETSKKVQIQAADTGGLPTWLEFQSALARKTGLAITTVQHDGGGLDHVENNNSICSMMLSSPELSRRCAQDCGRAFSKSRKSLERVEFRCHAGLRCFTVWVEGLQATVTGGRAFTSTSDYQHFQRVYGESIPGNILNGLRSVKFVTNHEFLENVTLIVDSARCSTPAGRDAEPLRSLEGHGLRQLLASHRFQEPRTSRLEVVRSGDRRRTDPWFDVLRDISDSSDASSVYDSLLLKVTEMFRAQRSSLLILNEQAKELSLEAAHGFVGESLAAVRVKMGDPVAGAVLESGKPLLVHDALTDQRVPGTRRLQYSAHSFISFPIQLGVRKLGVINLTNHRDGIEYTNEDLAAIEMMAPQIALMIDRTEWRKKAERFQQMSLTDALTGLPNRRYLDERLFEEVERSKRHQTALSFMIIDIDRFKSYNDLYGHPNADSVLMRTAQTLRRLVRAIDMPARFAGDEFCILLPETEIKDAARIAERLRAEVSQTDYRSEQGDPLGKVTISVGIASFGPSRQDPLSIVEAADRALYQAKTRGRNCVAVHEDSSGGR
jgi:diguanylate cyclase (GGDEF)-like protein